MLCETNIDNSSLNSQIQLKGFKAPFRLDREKHGGSMMIFMREDIQTKLPIMNKFL